MHLFIEKLRLTSHVFIMEPMSIVFIVAAIAAFICIKAGIGIYFANFTADEMDDFRDSSFFHSIVASFADPASGTDFTLGPMDEDSSAFDGFADGGGNGGD
ncbi:MAG: hypothetical protein EBT90_08475 [Rhodobacteraceae bacterium]|nr:hypothetical protein [Paracoccaceae bacterium]